jgi:hypothetical protein
VTPALLNFVPSWGRMLLTGNCDLWDVGYARDRAPGRGHPRMSDPPPPWAKRVGQREIAPRISSPLRSNETIRNIHRREQIVMRKIVRGTSSRGARVAIAIALVSMMLGGGSAALAGGGKAGGSAALTGGDKERVFVSGNSTYSDCGRPRSDYALAMTGDLEGCLSGFIQDYKCKELKQYDLYLEEGREVFVGKFDGKQGRFRTTYTFAGAYAEGFCESFDATLEVGGGCTHPIRGASGVFADAKGLIKFIDVVAGVTGDPTTGEFHAGTGGNNFVYYGHIGLDQDD